MSTNSPHPLAVALIQALGNVPAPVLEIAPGSGRNSAALRSAGYALTSIPDEEVGAGLASLPAGAYDASISTHGFLHGTSILNAARIGHTRRALRDGGIFYATFGSRADARFAKGTQLDAQTFAPTEGDEKGIAHVYYDERELRAVLEPLFVIDSIEECAVDDIVGRWAHASAPAGSVHWFVRARACAR